jgi:hypothetical protein
MSLPEMFNVIVLSTAHLPEVVVKDMDKAAECCGDRRAIGDQGFSPEDWRHRIVACTWADYGWWVWADTEDGFELLPECLRTCMLFARAHGARWIQFDRDGPIMDELPSFQW